MARRDSIMTKPKDARGALRRMLTFLGFLIALLGVIFGISIFVMTRLNGEEWGRYGVFTMFAILFVFIGAQFAGMGLLGEYIGKIHLNARGRPQYYIEKELHAGDQDKKTN